MAEIGGMTRSGRCYTPEELELRRKKRKDKMGGRYFTCQAAEEEINNGILEDHQEQ